MLFSSHTDHFYGEFTEVADHSYLSGKMGLQRQVGDGITRSAY
jgi:hypothetical protein